ncbi:hypothetical protein [Lactobacillus gasseri]|uniref:hypothetical protein n=1 Tax=Lactobacillus gasseri TaxID=1596 RepID=UPI00336ADB8A
MARKKKQKAYLDKYNTEIQYYRGIPFKLITVSYRAMRFLLNPEVDTEYRTQNFWIPKCYLEADGTLKSNVFVDWIFVRCVKENKFRYAGLEIPDWMRGKL